MLHFTYATTKLYYEELLVEFVYYMLEKNNNCIRCSYQAFSEIQYKKLYK